MYTGLKANYAMKTRLPKEFYDEKGRAIIDKIGVEEWFSGYQE
jgi:acid phosphatase